MSEDEKMASEIVDLQAAATIGWLRPHAWALLAADLTLDEVSDGFRTMTGLDQEPLSGQPISELLWEFVGTEDILFEIARGERLDLRLENVYRDDLDGDGRYLTFQVMPIGLDEQRPGLLLLVEDNSELAQLQQRLTQDRNDLRLARRQLEMVNESLRQLNRQKSLFLAMAAHDMRTPLTSIQGFTELVRHDVPDDWHEQQQMLDLIASQADRLQRVIANLLDLDVIERGQLTIRRRECVLNDMVYEILAALAPAIALQELVLETNIPDEPLVLWADPVRLEQIIYNLLGNALKYSRYGAVVTVTAGRSNDHVSFQVTNQGAELSQAQIRRLFDAYYRTESAQMSSSPGSGLGLYIVKMLVEAHGGEIGVESNVGAGNRFSVMLPAGDPEQGAPGGR
jgi:signal transduction histidine kinase